MVPAGFEDPGWDDDGGIGTPENARHVRRVACAGTLRRAGRFSFSRPTTYVCTLAGDVLTYTKAVVSKAAGATAAGGVAGGAMATTATSGAAKTVALSQVGGVRFEYDHTAAESSLKRNRILFVPEVDGAAPKRSSSAATGTSPPPPGTLAFSAPSDKEMARWEMALRALPTLRMRCQSTLRDRMGRLRPYKNGLSMAKMPSVASFRASAAVVGSVDLPSRETVHVVTVELPERLGILEIPLEQSSFNTTVGDLKIKVFDQLLAMRQQLKAKSMTTAEAAEDAATQSASASAGDPPAPVCSSGARHSSSNSTAATPPKSAAVYVQRQQFVNPLALALNTCRVGDSQSRFRARSTESTTQDRPKVDAHRLPNQTMNPFAALAAAPEADGGGGGGQARQARQARQDAAAHAPAGGGEEKSRDDAPQQLRPEQALARSELENVDEIIMCGLSAFVMYRPSRQGETVREGGDLWAFDESKSVESLGVSGDGMLTLELRHASDMPQSGLQCVVSKVLAKDIFGKTVDHYRMQIMHAAIRWVVTYRYARVKKFAASLHAAFQEISPEQRAQMGYAPLPRAPPGGDTQAAVQGYMDLVLQHPWASSGYIMLEFLGAATSARERSERTVLHVSQLREYVRAGDIVLFKCSDRWSAITRVALGSQFDHIGIVVDTKGADSPLEVLESTGEGVHAYPLVGRLRGYFLADYVHSISVRRIVGDRYEDALQNGRQFIKSVVGKPYRLLQAVTQGMGSRSNTGEAASGGRGGGRPQGEAKADVVADGDGDGGHSPRSRASSTSSASAGSVSGRRGVPNRRRRRSSTALSGNQKGYFCSELAAAYLKAIELIPSDDARSAAYWPGAFDEGGELEQDVEKMGYGIDKVVDLDLRILELAKGEIRAGVVVDGEVSAPFANLSAEKASRHSAEPAPAATAAF